MNKYILPNLNNYIDLQDLDQTQVYTVPTKLITKEELQKQLDEQSIGLKTDLRIEQGYNVFIILRA